MRENISKMQQGAIPRIFKDAVHLAYQICPYTTAALLLASACIAVFPVDVQPLLALFMSPLLAALFCLKAKAAASGESFSKLLWRMVPHTPLACAAFYSGAVLVVFIVTRIVMEWIGNQYGGERVPDGFFEAMPFHLAGFATLTGLIMFFRHALLWIPISTCKRVGLTESQELARAGLLSNSKLWRAGALIGGMLILPALFLPAAVIATMPYACAVMYLVYASVYEVEEALPAPGVS